MPGADLGGAAAGADRRRLCRRHVAALPPDIVGADPALFIESVARMKTCYSPDGVLPADGPATVLDILRASDPVVRAATIDLSATFTNAFTDKAPRP